MAVRELRTREKRREGRERVAQNSVKCDKIKKKKNKIKKNGNENRRQEEERPVARNRRGEVCASSQQSRGPNDDDERGPLRAWTIARARANISRRLYLYVCMYMHVCATRDACTMNISWESLSLGSDHAGESRAIGESSLRLFSFAFPIVSPVRSLIRPRRIAEPILHHRCADYFLFPFLSRKLRDIGD